MSTPADDPGATDRALVARDAEDVRAWLAAALPAPWLAVDTETTGWDPWSDRIRVLQLAAVPGSPVLVVDTSIVAPAAVAAVLADEGVLKVFHNAAFDLQMLDRAGLEVRRLADTMLAQQLLDAASATPMGTALATVAQARLGRTLDKGVRASFGEGADGWHGPLTAAQIDYAAEDARATWDVFAQQQAELRAMGLVEVARCEFAAVDALAAMQLRGIGFDPHAWHRVVSATETALPGLEATAQAALVTPESPRNLFGPEPVNLDSPEQVAAALGLLGIHVDSTREAVLRDHDTHPAVRALLAYRQAAKIVSGWGGDWADRAAHPVTGRVHARVRQIVGSGRMAHSDPNLTQVPADGAYRRCFVPAPGNALVIADYSQQELRVLAAVSGDEALAAVFRRGGDLHAETAALIFGVDIAQVSSAQRKAAKALNFGLMYGMGAAGFAKATNTGVAEARATIDAYFAAYPRVAAWLRRVESQARRHHRVATPLGRIRHLGADAGTFARNAPIQGAGADMIKLALAGAEARLRRRFGSAPADPLGVVLTVHDELVAEVPADAAADGAAIVREAMEDAAGAILGDVPAAVDLRVASAWG